MNSSSFLGFLFLITTSQAMAQPNGIVKGLVSDAATRQPLSDATISIFDAKDSSIISFSRTSQTGQFSIKSLLNNRYRLLVTHIGYQNLRSNFSISADMPNVNLGTLSMKTKTDLLESITVEQEIPPVTIKKDTVEFNAGSFKTKPNAVVEDLLKKLPGIKVEKNGTIKANGEEVKKILIDGKEFFGKDPTIASKNLPADAIDKVQVFDKKSDQAEFTGFEDGNKEKTINLTIKQNKKNGLFGKAIASGGNQDRYEGRLNLNQFKGSQQFSVIGMANNTNKQGFSFQDAMNFSGGMSGFGGKGVLMSDPFNSGVPIQGLTDNSQAITSTLAGGVNFNDSWNKKTDFSGSYFHNKAVDEINQKSTTQYLLPGYGYFQDQRTISNRNNENNRLNAFADIRMDSLNSFKLTSALIQQNSSISAQKNYSSRGTTTNQLLNQGFSNSFTKATGYSWNSSALYRHRFLKKGRTVSVNISLGLNNSRGNGSIFSINQFYQPQSTDSINQVNEQNSQSNSFGANLVYTEPLSKKTLLEFNYNFNRIQAQSDKRTFDADADGKYVLPNQLLTNHFDNSYIYHRQGISMRTQQKKFGFTAGLTLEEASLNNAFSYISMDSLIRQSFTSLLPNGNFQMNFNKYQRLDIFYNSFSRQPATTQLQPVADNSDPLNIKLGNPYLKQEYYHVVRINYGSFDPFRHTGFFMLFSYTGIRNKIVNSDQVLDAGIRMSKPVNLLGLYNMNTDLSWGFPLRKLKSNLNINSNTAFDHNASLVNGVRNISNNWHLGQGADLSYYYKEITDFTAGLKFEYYDSRYSLAQGHNEHYWTQNYYFEWNLYLSRGFSIATDLNYLHRTGLSAEYNNSPLIWNAGMAKQLFKNKKGEVRLQVFDILKQNIGISRNTNQNYVQDVSYHVLNRYLLVSFTYNISRFAGKSINGAKPGKGDIKIISN